MNILLVNPPLSSMMGPLLGIPTLAAYLRMNGYADRVSLLDLGIDWYTHIMSPEYLGESTSHLLEKLEQLEARADLSEEEIEHKSLLKRSAGSLSRTARNASRAVEIMKTPELFYNPKRLLFAFSIFNKIRDVINAIHYPTSISDTWNRMDFGLSIDEPENVMRIAKDPNTNPFYHFLEQTVKTRSGDSEPVIAGISVTYQSQLMPALTLAYFMKRENLTSHVVLGGSYLSHVGRELLDCSILFDVVDSIILYEGEIPLLRLCHALENGQSLEHVPSLIHMDNGRPRLNEIANPVDLEALPFADYGDLDLGKYLAPSPTIMIKMSRGCYYARCAFCAISPGNFKKYRQRSVERVVEHMRSLQEDYGVEHFFFADDIVPVPVFKELSNLISREGLRANWEGQTRFEKALDRDVLARLKESGCSFLNFGLESGSCQIQNAMRKGLDLGVCSRILKTCREVGIPVNVFVIFGFPSETEANIEETLDFLSEHRDNLASISYGKFRLLKDSPIYDNPSEYGIARLEKPMPSALQIIFDYKVQSGMTREDLDEVFPSLEERIARIAPGNSTIFYSYVALLYFGKFGYGAQAMFDGLEASLLSMGN